MRKGAMARGVVYKEAEVVSLGPCGCLARNQVAQHFLQTLVILVWGLRCERRVLPSARTCNRAVQENGAKGMTEQQGSKAAPIRREKG